SRSSILNLLLAPPSRILPGNNPSSCQLSFRKNPERTEHEESALALAAAAIGVTALVASSPAEARWRGGWAGGWGPGLAAGLVGAAVIGGLASSAYAYGPGYGDYGYPGYGYGPGYGYAPAYYGYGYGSDPYAWDGYSTTYCTGYAPAYGYRRVVRPASPIMAPRVAISVHSPTMALRASMSDTVMGIA